MIWKLYFKILVGIIVVLLTVMGASASITVDCEEKWFPNSVNVVVVNLDAPAEEVLISLEDSDGNTFFSQRIEDAGSSFSVEISIPNNFREGEYILGIVAWDGVGRYSEAKRVVVQDGFFGRLVKRMHGWVSWLF